jgi:hypothetical protein
MTDDLDLGPELALLRAADPVSTVQGPYRDQQLSPEAERRLAALRNTRRTRKVWARPTLLAAATLTAVAVFVGVLFSGANPTPAVAAPRPLATQADPTPVPLSDVARGARLLEEQLTAQGGATATRRGSHYQTWSLAMESGPGASPPLTLPEERMVRWDAGRRTDLTVATDPTHPEQPVIADKDGTPTAVSDGTVLHRTTDAPGAMGTTTFWTAPPHDPAGLRRYLLEWGRGSGPVTTQVLEALSTFLGEWTPGTRDNAALAALLAGTDGLRPVGAITDRLGRHGQGYAYEPAGPTAGIRYLLILDPRGGKVLGLEETFVHAVPDVGAAAGAVMSYEAWMDE